MRGPEPAWSMQPMINEIPAEENLTKTFLAFLSLLTFSLPAFGQSVPSSFANAEGSTTPTSLPDSYSFYSYNSSTGSKASASASAGHTFGVQADASITGDKSASVTSQAVLRIESNSAVSNTIGGPPDGVNFLTNASSDSKSSFSSTPNSESTQVQSQSTISSAIQGISAVATLNIAPSAEDCSSDCTTGSSFTSTATLSTPSTETSPATSSANGTAKGYMNSSINTNAEQSSFTQVFMQTF